MVRLPEMVNIRSTSCHCMVTRGLKGRGSNTPLVRW